MKMKLLPLMLILTACSTTKELQQAGSCKVWKEEPLFGPTSVDVGKGAYWSGQCKNLWWECKSVSVDAQVNEEGVKEVFIYTSLSEQKISWGKENKAAGIITGDEFHYAGKNILENMISVSPLKADAATKTVSYTANLHFMGTTSTATYYFNDHCSNEQALLGALAVSTVSNLNNQNPPK